MKVIFDCNIYDKFDVDADSIDLMLSLIENEKIEVLVTRTVREELIASPFNGIPDFFPFTYTGNTVGRTGIMCTGDSLGSGEFFDEHLGKSKKKNDALIADTASWKADVLVTEDIRFATRLNKINSQCSAKNYSEFILFAKKLAAQR